MGDKLGIIAGNGKFPLILARNARQKGVEVVVIALSEEAEPALEEVASKVHWMSAAQLGKMIKTFKKEGISEAIMAGQLVKRRMYTSEILKLDLTAAKLWAMLPDRRGDTILKTVAAEFEKNGIRLLDSTTHMETHLAGKGPMTRRKLTKSEQADIEYGYMMAKVIAEHDIGQSIVVKDLSVVAVEAIEGTDACIRRAGGLAKTGVVVVKVSRKGHDMRFDVPVVGMRTLDALRDAGARVMAIEAGKTLMLEKDEFIDGAESSGIAIIGV